MNHCYLTNIDGAVVANVVPLFVWWCYLKYPGYVGRMWPKGWSTIPYGKWQDQWRTHDIVCRTWYVVVP